MTGARIYKANNRLADSVDVRFGLRLDDALLKADDAVRDSQGDMRESIRTWVEEIGLLCSQPEPDKARLLWLTNGVLGISASCGLMSLSKCGGLFGRALELMGDGWRQDMGLIYARALARFLDGSDKAADEAAVLASLDSMNQRLETPETLAAG